MPQPVLAHDLALLADRALRTALSRLRARWRERLRELVAETVQEGHTVDDELRHLLTALTPPAL